MKFKIGILILICNTFAFLSYGQKIVLDQVIGVVGGKMIKLSDIEIECTQLKLNGYPVDENSKCTIFENMLQHKLMLNQAIFDSIQVTDSQVEGELTKRLNKAVDEAGSVAKIEETYNQSFSSIKNDLRENIKDMMLVEGEQMAIVKDITITPDETGDFYKRVSKDSLPKINAQMELVQLCIYPPATGKSIEELKDKLLALRKRIIDGERFATLAGLYSEDGAARKGGEIGFLTKAELDPEYARAAFALNKPGDVSRIVESQMGYHIIQLIAKKGEQVNTRHIIMTPKPDPENVIKGMHALDSIGKLIRKDSLDFNKAIAMFSMDIDTRYNNGLVINPYSGTSKFESEQIPPADYNAIKNLKPGELSAPFESRDKNGKVVYKLIRIKSKTAAHIANLTDDYNLIQDFAKSSKQQKALSKWLNEKRKSTYIFIDDSFKNCQFKSDQWLKSIN